MPVPEPSNEGGLWQSVRDVTGWPETDEDRLARLAGDWRAGAQGFTTAGTFDLSGLGGSWPDPAGEATGARARGTLINVTATADGMMMLADRVDAFAASVRGCKVDIGRIVELNIPAYVQARRLPPGLRENDATLIRTSVITQVNDRIGGCVREIGAQGLLPADLPVDPRLPGGTLGGLLEEDPTAVTRPEPPWAQTGAGPLVQLPGALPGTAGGPADGGPGIGGPLGGAIDTANAADGTQTGPDEEPGQDPPGGTAVPPPPPDFSDPEIHPNKIGGYALNPDHPVGGNKYRVIHSATGLGPEDAASVEEQIRDGVQNGTPQLGKADQYGQRWWVNLPLSGPNGQITVQTAWIVDTGSSQPRLVTISFP